MSVDVFGLMSVYILLLQCFFPRCMTIVRISSVVLLDHSVFALSGPIIFLGRLLLLDPMLFAIARHNAVCSYWA